MVQGSGVAAPLVGDVLTRAYRQFADRPAVGDDRVRLSYRELGDRARRVAGGLAELGCVPGDRVAFISPNRVEYFEADHACLMGGFARLSPITRLHPLEIRAILQDAEPRVAVVESGWLRSAGTDWLPPGVEHVVEFGHRDGTLADILDGSDVFEPVRPDPDTIVGLSYTSGSTGKPKGVVWTQRCIGATVRNIAAEMGNMTGEDVAIHTAPLSHFSGAIGLALFSIGATNLVRAEFDLEALVAALDAGEVSVLPLVPTQINRLVEELGRRIEQSSPVDVSRLRLLPYAGSAIPPDRLAAAQRVLGSVLLQFYGSTEAPMPITALSPDDHVAALTPERSKLLASAGLPSPYVEMLVRDDDGRPVPDGETGEIVVRGPHVMPEYWRNRAETEATLDADGWCRTGDLGFVDGEGYLFIVDRKKDMIVTGGFNVYPREVESALSPLAGVREVAVVGAPSERWGEEVVAVVEPHDGETLTEEQVIAHCRAHIAGYKVPKRVVFVDELPRSGNGKVMKVKLKDRFWEGRTRRV
ncbi:MAG TPA: AMP-binding protein [Pseudonocardia sp.]|jgi:acyl-CoA synthetase (AMP-forming)/AMP-acid ligase II|nr:AMP-binding protein [Pseudonocardia sp.]